jgi:hypothetical protein
VDWQDIPPIAEWLKEIDSAIDAAQANLSDVMAAPVILRGHEQNVTSVAFSPDNG